MMTRDTWFFLILDGIAGVLRDWMLACVFVR
jgi:hypothetical protein